MIKTKVYLAHEGKGAENEGIGALIGVFSTEELARDVARQRGGAGGDGKVVIRDAMTPAKATGMPVFPMDPAYADQELMLDDEAGLIQIRRRAYEKLNPAERKALGLEPPS